MNWSCTHGSRNSGEGRQLAKSSVNRVSHELIPVFSGSNFHSTAKPVDTFSANNDHRAWELVIPADHIAAPTQDQKVLTLLVKVLDHINEFLFGRDPQGRFRLATNTQSCVVTQGTRELLDRHGSTHVQNVWSFSKLLQDSVICFLALLLTVFRFTVVVTVMPFLSQRKHTGRNSHVVSHGSNCE